MFNWIKSGINTVSKLKETNHGRKAIYTIDEKIETDKLDIYRPSILKDLEWKHWPSTHVELLTIYFIDIKKQYNGFIQILHSNMLNIHKLSQMTFKLVYEEEEKKKKNIWVSEKISDHEFKGANYYSKKFTIEFSDDNQLFKLKMKNKELIIELKTERVTDGIVFGDDGKTVYGHDRNKPSGFVSHVFWPHCKILGTVDFRGEVVELDTHGVFIKALQAMKPYHAAMRWNFLYFQSETYTATIIEFITPESYDHTKINLGFIIENSKIYHVSYNNKLKLNDEYFDEIHLKVPKSISVEFVDNKLDSNKTTDNLIAFIEGKTNSNFEKFDLMHEIPSVIKSIFTGISGLKPYIYQFSNKFDIKIKNNQKESGVGFFEISYVS